MIRRSQEVKIAKEATIVAGDMVVVEAEVEPMVMVEAMMITTILRKVTKIMEEEDKKVEVEGMIRVKFNVTIAINLSITFLSAILINLIKFMRKLIMPRRKMMEMTCFY